MQALWGKYPRSITTSLKISALCPHHSYLYHWARVAMVTLGKQKLTRGNGFRYRQQIQPDSVGYICEASEGVRDRVWGLLGHHSYTEVVEEPLKVSVIIATTNQLRFPRHFASLP